MEGYTGHLSPGNLGGSPLLEVKTSVLFLVLFLVQSCLVDFGSDSWALTLVPLSVTLYLYITESNINRLFRSDPSPTASSKPHIAA
jgi:hypothetical protein